MQKNSYIGKHVMCMVRSAYETKSVTGIIVKKNSCDNIYTLKIDHPVDFMNGRVYHFPTGSTMMVSLSEIMK